MTPIAMSGPPPHSRLLAARDRDRRALDAVYEAAKIMTGLHAPSGEFVSVLHVLTSFLDLDAGMVALLAEPDRPLATPARNPWIVVATLASDAPRPARESPIPGEIVDTVLRTGFAAQVEDLAARFGEKGIPEHLRGPSPVSLLIVPICQRGAAPSTLGVLAAHRTWRDPAAVSLDEDQRVLTMVANLMASAILTHRAIGRDRDRLMTEARQREKSLDAVRLHRPGTGRAGTNGSGRTSDRAPDRAPDRTIVGESPAIAEVVARIAKVAPTRATVLLRGESGTGKELFAEALHRMSGRAAKPFVKVNCAALTETLLESELFGHEKGAFTGAQAQKKGRFELADGGTLFLDEIGEIGPAFQAKLLRALQEREFERVGGTQTLRVDVRLVAATNKDLEEAVANGTFRADLYFRICVVPITLPPLRERPDDIPRLAESFLERFNAENGSRLRFGRQAMDRLRTCYFPGNVRELENCVARVAALSAGPTIEPGDLACANDDCLSTQLWALSQGGGKTVGGLGPRRVELPVLDSAPRPVPPACPRADRPAAAPSPSSESERLVDAMERAGWVQAKAARLLGLTPRQIGYALKKHGIEVQRF